jgi:dienelactone hydrolase
MAFKQRSSKLKTVLKPSIFSMLLLAFSATATISNAAVLADLSGGQTGRIEFASITPPNRWEYLREYKQNTKDVVVYGDLLMPKNAGDSKVPAVVLSHGSGGVNPALYDVWAKELTAAGYAVFIIDHFKPRGIDSTVGNQAQIDISAGIADVYNALKLLATHPKIDARRIALSGFSRGGHVTYEAYFDAARKPVVKDGLKFAAYIPVYQGGCAVRIRSDRGNTNNAPMLALFGGKDDAVGDPQNCIDMFKDVNANAGANVTWKVYESAYHGFDTSAPYRFDRWAQTDRNCTLEVDVLSVPKGLGAARNFKTGATINGWDEWNTARKECKTTGHAVSGDTSVRAEAVKDVLTFLQSLK